ncbi:GntR family transcriptional regulator [Actinopolyspora halophila]|uniref:GntR family transcriptional regulator n=1 Tax=Actinopolyspora halophila TaxID=1850 RepID=UPI00035F09A4|nr:GntR family transcriptional regulator [Actinopolyspora halophila]
MTGQSRNAVILTDSERATLVSWTRSRNRSRAAVLRAQIVLACEQEATNTAVAGELGVSVDTVRKWRRRFIAERLDGLTERHRSGRPPSTGEDTITQVLVRLLGPAPTGRRWSTRAMASAVGTSQKAVSRIWRKYRIQPTQRTPVPEHAGRARLPLRIHDVAGLFLDPPTRVLAVTADADAPSPQQQPTTATMHRRTAEARELFAVANAFSEVNNGTQQHDRAADDTRLRAFLDSLDRSVPARMTIHLLVDGPSSTEHGTTGQRPGEHSRLRWHTVPPQGSWLDEVDVLLAHNPLPSNEYVLGFGASLAGLREELRTWCDTWNPPGPPFSWTKSPRSLWRGDHDYRGLTNDSNSGNAPRVRTPETDGQRPHGDTQASTSGTTRVADHVAQLVREALAGGRFKPGERIKEAPLANRLGVSRGPVREALRVLGEEGMLELLPNRGAAVPHMSTTSILDLYASRASLGGLLMRRMAMHPRSSLGAVSSALAEVQHVARNNDHARIGEADLHFQDTIARTANLPQTGVIFERLSMRLRMFNAVLRLDWAEAMDLIAHENSGIHDAIRNGDGNEAARRWRVKIERSVRYMVAQLPQDHFDLNLWVTIAGKPDPRPGDPRNAHAGAGSPPHTDT